MTQKEFFDVEVPTLDPSGPRDLSSLGQITCIALATLMGEVMEQVSLIQVRIVVRMTQTDCSVSL